MRISIILPTYNYAHYITDAIHSVLQEKISVHQLEIIVIDDGSTDDTRKVLETFIQAGDIRYYYQSNKGKATATKKGIELATGDIIFNLDADDYFLPGKIEKTISLFEKYPEIVHVSGPAKIEYEDGHASEIEPIPAKWLNRPLNGIALIKEFFEKKLLYGGGSSFAAKACVLKTITWDVAVDMYTDEWLLIETLLKGDSYFMSEPLSVWRVHSNNYSGNAAADQLGIKQQRLEKSSSAILQLLEKGNYPDWLVKLYRLKHQVRCMVWLEESQQKKPADIIQFFRQIIMGGYPLQVLQQYHAFNRLLPTWVKKAMQ